MAIIYKKGSLFNAPKESALLHAVNAQGVWGSGIAKEFKIRFPQSFEQYHDICMKYGSQIVGHVAVANHENDYYILGICTSYNYAEKKDSIGIILENTKFAIKELLLQDKNIKEIHSCKFNSGLFGVPWEETEKVLNEVIREVGYTKDWTVWEL